MVTVCQQTITSVVRLVEDIKKGGNRPTEEVLKKDSVVDA